MNLSTKQTLGHREQTDGCLGEGEGLGAGMEWEVGISRKKLLYIEWINNQALLYSTTNYIQYPMRNHNGKRIFKKTIYAYITESLCCTAEINAAL